MRLHDPEAYEAHRLRDYNTLSYIANLMNLTVNQASERNWEMSDIDDNVALPSEETTPKRRGRPRKTDDTPKASKTVKNTQVDALVSALTFVSPVEDDIQAFGEYVRLANNQAVMFNGIVAAGHPIVEELNVSPHLSKLLAALKRCGKSMALAETPNQQLSVRGDKLKVVVPCHMSELPPAEPDAPILTGDYDIIKLAFAACGILANEKGERVHEASLLLDPNTCTGTNGACILQFWHGIANLPAGTVVPKEFAAFVAKQKTKITGIGGNFNPEKGFLTSLTIWFENGAWIKTQCFEDRWPSIAHILDVPVAPSPVPEGLWDAISAVMPFSEGETHKAAILREGMVTSHVNPEVGAQYDVKGLPPYNIAFDGNLIAKIAPFAKSIDIQTEASKMYFFGGEQTNPIRGCLMAMNMPGQIA